MKNLYPAKPAKRSLLIIALLCVQFAAHAYQKMATNFYVIGTNGPVLMDGNMTIYDDQYSNAVDWHDGTKMNNAGENWGIMRDGVSLVVERRKLVVGRDTTFFNMWGLQQRSYRFEVKLSFFENSNLTACVWDEYLRQITPISLIQSTFVDFTVDANPASKAANRFKLYYMTPAEYVAFYNSVAMTLPVTFTAINATRSKDDVQVSWSVENETSIDYYQVEASADGRTFKSLENVKATNNSGAHAYSYVETSAGRPARYYRIKSISASGKTAYTNIAKVGAIGEQAGVTIYPNPVVNKTAQLQWNTTTAAEYKVTLISPVGKSQSLNSIKVAAGQSAGTLQLPAGTTPGMYQVRFVNAANEVIVKSIIVL